MSFPLQASSVPFFLLDFQILQEEFSSEKQTFRISDHPQKGGWFFLRLFLFLHFVEGQKGQSQQPICGSQLKGGQ